MYNGVKWERRTVYCWGVITIKRTNIKARMLVTATLILCICFTATQSFAAQPGSWSVGVGFMLWGCPGISLDAMYYLGENVGVAGEVSLGFKMIDAFVPVVWVGAGAFYELPVKGEYSAQVSMNLSHVRLNFEPDWNMVEVGIGMRKQLSEQRDFIAEMKLVSIYDNGYSRGWDPWFMPLAFKFGYITNTYGD